MSDIESAEERYATSGFTVLMVLVTLIAVAIGVVVSLRMVTKLTHMIGGEPEEAVALISQLSRGDLSIRVRTKHDKSIMAAVARHTVEAAQVAGDAQNAAELMQRGEQQTTVSVEQARSEIYDRPLTISLLRVAKALLKLRE